jgi:hypothetical protein
LEADPVALRPQQVSCSCADVHFTQFESIHAIGPSLTEAAQ